MATFKPYPFLLGFVILFCFVRPTLAFGAGNIASISKVEGQNWRHGDIEDALLKIAMARVAGGKKFDKLMVSRVYFGNWLRDYSQAIDVGTVKSVSAEAIRLLLCILGFLTFGYGSREFEVTADRLGCYRPEDHIDNPKNYADNLDARQYDRRLRGPVDESVELAIDEETGMKNYIANENVGIMTSAKHVRRLFTKCIELGRSYGRSRNKEELYEALRLMGTGLHCLEDFFAHSNYTELALIELGENEVFPHVGRNTKLRIPGARHEVYPLVTGTFGGVDFLHSVTGEVSDKMTQSEIEDLEGTLKQSSNNDTSLLRDLLDKIPDGLLGGNNKSKLDDIQSNAQAAQMENLSVSPREPEELTRYVQEVFRQIMPAIEFHDQLLQDISEAIDKIPVLPKIVEQLEEQMSIFVFQIMAPFVVPLIEQIKNELATGSSEIIQSSKAEQHNVFEDDNATDPTHSMLAKDHFSNILNEIGGRAASKVVSWVVPQLMEAWDDDSVDVDRLLDKIIYGVFHHPAQRTMGPEGASEGRELIFNMVREWWEDMSDWQRDEYRRKLSREGVERGDNHREGQHDCGHGCGGKLKMHKNFRNEAPQTVEDQIAGAAAEAIMGGVKQGLSQAVQNAGGGQESSESSGLGGFISSVAGGLLGGAFKTDETESYQAGGRTEDGGYTQTTTEYGYSGGRYGQAQYTETQYGGGGGGRSEYRRYEQREDDDGRVQSYGYTEQRTETRYDSYSGGYGGREESSSYGGSGSASEYIRSSQQSSYGGSGYGSGYGRRDEEESSGYGSGYGRRDEEESGGYGGGYGRRQEEESSGYGSGYGRRDEEESGGYGGGYGRRNEEESSGYGSGYGRRHEEEGSGYGSGYGRRRNDDDEEEEEENGGRRRWGY
ncbi:heterokaryon incompatibility protein Het-C-domain-containing protein [Thermothelomyces heterothallicus CBS 202.75]|uniref:heterokaryon incompatibility protein Het-C-domain-containing protein n=1 Tax=Thermothelomyces heterothallicus CBS 202.75 TaxID=1149848 RepID=UPI0037423CC5